MTDPAYEVLPILRKHDVEGRFPIIGAFWVKSMEVRMHYERKPDGLDVFIPEIYRTAPPSVFEYRLGAIIRRAYGEGTGPVGATDSESNDMVKWAYSSDYIHAYRKILYHFSASYFLGTGHTASETLEGIASEVLQLVPECRRNFSLLKVGLRKEALDLTKFPMTSSSPAGQMIMLDPALLAPGTPRLLAKYAVFNDLLLMIANPGGLWRTRTYNNASVIAKYRPRFKCYEKVEEAYVRLGWFFEWSSLDRCGPTRVQIVGRAIDRGRGGKGDPLEIPPYSPPGLHSGVPASVAADRPDDGGQGGEPGEVLPLCQSGVQDHL